jgi:hypothetical protein
MNDPLDDRLESLVRAHLDRRAESVDPRPLFARVQASLGRRPRAARRWAWPMAAAAAVMAAFLLWQGRAPAQASAARLVEEARKAHHLPLDRCYLVELRPESGLLDEAAPAQPPRTTHLWTRGDRFWVEAVGPRLTVSWGRDDKGRVWMAFGPRRAVRVEPDEVPRWLAVHCDTLTLRPETLLNEVLAHFELTREASAGDAATQVVRATRKFPHPFASLRSAVLEIDAETKVIRRLTLERMRQGRLVATVTYTLAETRVLDDGKYELEGHLVEPYEVYTREYRPERRQVYLGRWFGPHAARWFAPNLNK